MTAQRYSLFHPWWQAYSGSLASGIHSSDWKNPNCWRGCCIEKLILWKAQRLYLFFHRFWEDRCSTVIKPCLCVIIIRCSTVHLVRVRAKSFNAWSSRILGLETRPGNGGGKSPLFIARLSSPSSIGSFSDVKFVSTTVSLVRLKRWEVWNVTLESRLLLPFACSHGIWIETCVIRCLCESFWLHHFLVEFQINTVSGKSQRPIKVVSMRSAGSAEFFVQRLILQRPAGLDVDSATTLGEKESETLRKMVTSTMHMYNVIIFVNEEMRESASANVIFVES